MSERPDEIDLKAEREARGQAQDALYGTVLEILEAHQLLRRELRQPDSLSCYSDDERRRIQTAVRHFHTLTEDDQAERPALQHAIGKVQMIVGEYGAALRDFQAVAERVQNPRSRAEVLANACTAATEQADWATAHAAFQAAVQLDAERWAPFPMKQYELQRLAGADAFGTLFRCFHRESGSGVVVRALRTEDLDRPVADVFARLAQLSKFQHRAILRVRAAEYLRPETRAKPYVVVDQFLGQPLDTHVERQGPLAPRDFLAVMQLVAGGLQAAHTRNLVHGAVRPSNVLVLADDAGWKVQLTDFGLVFKPSLLQAPPRSAVLGAPSLRSGSIARALEYAAPEQMGRLTGVYPGEFSDVYGFGKTCCYALFRTATPTPQHWQSMPAPLAELLQQCLQEIPQRRLPDFGAVLERLTQLRFANVGRVVPALAAGPIVATVAAMPPAPLAAAQANAPVAVTAARPPGTGSSPRPPAAPSAPPAPRFSPWVWAFGVVGLSAVVAVIAVCLLLVLLFSRSARRAEPVQVSRDSAPPAARPSVHPAPNERRAPPVVPDDPDAARVLSGHPASVTSVAFRPDGRRVLSGDGNGAIYLWDPDSGRIVQRFFGVRSTVTSLAFSPDGHSCLSGSLDRTAILWDADVGEPKRRFPGHTDAVLAVAFSAEGRRALSFDRAGTLRAWDAETGEEVFKVATGATICAFAANGRRALTATGDRMVQSWDLANGQELRRWPAGQRADFTALALSPDGRRGYSGGKDKVLRSWDVDGGREGRGITGEGIGEIISLAVSPDGRRFLSGDSEGELRLWNTATGALIKRLPGHEFRVTGVAFSPDGRRAVSGGYDQKVRLWKIGD
jgi:serine/threonine protein kinase